MIRSFIPHYGGTQFERDMAYHQGTVWAYPLGAYYRACIRFSDEPKQTAKEVLHQLDQLNAALAEGCLGQIAEIYDGECPAESRGCFAQAWSVASFFVLMRMRKLLWFLGGTYDKKRTCA